MSNIKEPSEIVSKNKIITKKNVTTYVSQSKKASSIKTFNVSSYKALNSALTTKKYENVNINIKSNIKLSNNPVLSKTIKKLTINGHGNTISGAKKYRFLVTTGTVTIKNLRIINCFSSEGGAIKNKGTLTITNSTLNYNKAEYGGAILNDGAMTIKNSNLVLNTATGEGGAISNGGSSLILNLPIL